jgi:hypothetical protein
LGTPNEAALFQNCFCNQSNRAWIEIQSSANLQFFSVPSGLQRNKFCSRELAPIRRNSRSGSISLHRSS